MSFSWSTFALQLINFLILVWLLKRFLFQPLNTILKRRKAEIERARADVEAAQRVAEQSRIEFERRRSEIESQRQKLLEQTREQLAEEKEKIVQAAQAEIGRSKAVMLKQLEEQRQLAADEVSDDAVELGLQLACRLLEQCAGPSADELFLAHLGNHLDHLSSTERMALAQSGPLLVTTAAPLEGGRQSRWREILTRQLGGAPQITFAVDHSLIAGLELKFPLAVLRFSFRDALAKAQQELTRREHVG